jgi:3-dehydroquinate dehydratase-2
MQTVFVLNGPNINMLGTREPELYGRRTLDDVRRLCDEVGRSLDFAIDLRQTNHEGVLIDWIHEAHAGSVGVVLNAAALARTSLSLHDAVKAVQVPVIEVHITNIYKRESYRPPSYLSKAAVGVICGFGTDVYALGLHALKGLLAAGTKAS